MLPWLYDRCTLTMNGDTLWLVEALRRVLNGDTMVSGAYEPNPPLALLMHIPPLFLVDGMGVPLPYAMVLYTLGAVILSAIGVYAIISRWTFLNEWESNLITAAWIVGNTILSSSWFGERDHFVIIGMGPFVLMQLTLTCNWPYNKKLVWPVFLLGAILIVLKPPHGLLPSLLLIHRMIKQQRIFSILKDPDFISLAAVTTLYAAIVWVFFNDYATIILPQLINIYIPARVDIKVVTCQFLVASLCVALVPVFQKSLAREKRMFIFFLAGCAISSLVAFYSQSRGYYYHLIPTVVFLWVGMMTIMMFHIEKEKVKPSAAIFVCAIFMMIGAYVGVLPMKAHTTHDQYKDLVLVKMVADCPQKQKEDCSFFIFNGSMEIPQKIAYYSGTKLASRFPSYWPLPYGLRDPTGQSPVRYQLADMTAEDLARYKPHVALIGRLIALEGQGIFDMPAFFEVSGSFRREWSKYKKTGTITVPFDDYLEKSQRYSGSTLTYDIYRRQAD